MHPQGVAFHELPPASPRIVEHGCSLRKRLERFFASYFSDAVRYLRMTRIIVWLRHYRAWPQMQYLEIF